MSVTKDSSPFKLPENCIYCRKAFRKEDIDLIDEINGNSVHHLTCHNCGVSFVFHLVMSRDGILSVGAITDAGKEDLEKLKRGENITADDVISAYMETKKTPSSK